MTLHIHRGPECYEVATGDLEHRWCFQCRRRTWHQWTVHTPYLDQLSYYGPKGAMRCADCNQDHTRFGGGSLFHLEEVTP